YDRFTDRIAGVVDHDLRRHWDPFTCRIYGIRNEIPGRADFPIGAMPIGDITAATAAGTAERLKPGSQMVRNVVQLAVGEARRRRDKRSDRKGESHRRSCHDHGVVSASGTVEPVAQSTDWRGRVVVLSIRKVKTPGSLNPFPSRARRL